MSVVRVNFCWQFMNRRIKLCVQYIKEATARTRVERDKQEEERERERESGRAMKKGKQGEDGGRNDA